MRYLWPVISVICFIWASMVTYQYVRVKNNPVIMGASNLVNGSESEYLSQIEKLSFLRRFVEKYVSFEPDTFWQEQIALSFLMESKLRDERLAEVNRLKEKIQKNRITQHGKIVSIQEVKGVYVIDVDISVSETKNLNQLKASLSIQIQETARSLDNPWGFVVSHLHFSNLVSRVNGRTGNQIFLSEKKANVLSFPCAVENFEVPSQIPLKVKITTLNVSEIQLYLEKNVEADVEVKALCKDREFSLSLSSAIEAADLYIDFNNTNSQPREKLVKAEKKKAGNQYRKTIENELGFVIEE